MTTLPTHSTISIQNPSLTTTTTTTTAINNESPSCLLSKKYSLVKWLENSQFDVNNEWLGRLTSVPHSNIIDFDIDELKTGMEISVFRNGGEIWRAQVIIPKTASNTIDLPPSSQRISKIRTKALATTTTNSNINKLNDSIDSMDTNSPTNSNHLIGLTDRTFVDLNDFTVDDDSINTSNNNSNNNTNSINNKQNNSTLMLLTTSNGILSPNLISTQSSNDINSSAYKLNKELQFLQKAINDAGLTDFYQTLTTNSTNDLIQPLCQQSPLLSSSSNNNIKSTLNQTQFNENNIETILQMQSELLEQQKELKSIEYETMEQLRLLQHNLNRLAKKFDSFENVILNYSQSVNCNINSNNSNNINHNSNSIIGNNTMNFNFKTTKSNLNKLNNSIQQIKVIK